VATPNSQKRSPLLFLKRGESVALRTGSPPRRHPGGRRRRGMVDPARPTSKPGCDGKKRADSASPAQVPGGRWEQMIAAGELSRRRTLIAGAGAEHHFQARADSRSPSELGSSSPNPAGDGTSKSMPITRDMAPPAAPASGPVMERTRDGRARAFTTLDIPGKGPHSQEIEDPTTAMCQTGAHRHGLVREIGAAGMVRHGGFYRSVQDGASRSWGRYHESFNGDGTAGRTDTGVLTVARSFRTPSPKRRENALLSERAGK